MPTYERLLTQRLTYSGRHRQLPAWCKAFKREWRRCEVATIDDPEGVVHAYNPLPYRWVCGCRAFVKSRFLICKHLVQMVHRVPTKFFRQVSRERSFPIWRHPDLRPLAPPCPQDLQKLVPSSIGVKADGQGKYEPIAIENGDSEDDPVGDNEAASSHESDSGIDDEVEDDEEGTDKHIEKRKQEMKTLATHLRDLASAIDYNATYADPRALNLFTRKTKPTIDFIKKIRQKEKTIHSTTTPKPSVFTGPNSDLMFVRTRPRNHGRSTEATEDGVQSPVRDNLEFLQFLSEFSSGYLRIS
ncbi:hypothetical protein M408DRAFT_78720 [Serendipita vermifera MAFF 305830]|uniref:SWIM-type domain-containing protein n=1 Tax=Serendipita vermifera MAFF 305830 TaxID=933852 RepID=A0A0C3ATT9_SERVB|nr:hypothetical protein M408DRAFT_78720 [Serendipita vermifera MAFF 305830]